VLNFNDYDNTGNTSKNYERGGADVVIDCVGMDGKMTVLKWQKQL
jgi:S-(hydroxymethyl)glutathione dehydrogenase/alcohol dehydrogenase